MLIVGVGGERGRRRGDGRGAEGLDERRLRGRDRRDPPLTWRHRPRAWIAVGGDGRSGQAWSGGWASTERPSVGHGRYRPGPRYCGTRGGAGGLGGRWRVGGGGSSGGSRLYDRLHSSRWEPRQWLGSHTDVPLGVEHVDYVLRVVLHGHLSRCALWPQDVDGCTALEELAHGVDAAGADRDVEGRFALWISSVGIGSMIEEDVHLSQSVVLGSHHEGRLAIRVLTIEPHRILSQCQKLLQFSLLPTIFDHRVEL